LRKHHEKQLRKQQEKERKEALAIKDNVEEVKKEEEK